MHSESQLKLNRPRFWKD